MGLHPFSTLHNRQFLAQDSNWRLSVSETDALSNRVIFLREHRGEGAHDAARFAKAQVTFLNFRLRQRTAVDGCFWPITDPASVAGAGKAISSDSRARKMLNKLSCKIPQCLTTCPGTLRDVFALLITALKLGGCARQCSEMMQSILQNSTPLGIRLPSALPGSRRPFCRRRQNGDRVKPAAMGRDAHAGKGFDRLRKSEHGGSLEAWESTLQAFCVCARCCGFPVSAVPPPSRLRPPTRKSCWPGARAPAGSM